jgi:hypothetical protein
MTKYNHRPYDTNCTYAVDPVGWMRGFGMSDRKQGGCAGARSVVGLNLVCGACSGMMPAIGWTPCDMQLA